MGLGPATAPASAMAAELRPRDPELQAAVLHTGARVQLLRGKHRGSRGTVDMVDKFGEVHVGIYQGANIVTLRLPVADVQVLPPR